MAIYFADISSIPYVSMNRNHFKQSNNWTGISTNLLCSILFVVIFILDWCLNLPHRNYINTIKIKITLQTDNPIIRDHQEP